MKRVLLRLGDKRRVHVPLISETEANGNGISVVIQPDKMTVIIGDGNPLEFEAHNNLWKHNETGYLAVIEDPLEVPPLEKRATVEQIIAYRKKSIDKKPERVLGMGDHLAIIINASYVLQAASLVSFVIGKLTGAATKKCGCSARIAKLNELGPDWAEQHLGEVIDLLREGHRELRLPVPFVPSVARDWIVEAIRLTRG